ncbi:hypothetical protein RhiirA4_474024 [Rhizophagus irregularis]|uniref:Uncharacterized protein n=1 Tax=Rhizophagus irregularis TaxID=588596 RepID=A0A2I1H7T9_9GLOM|nr:hypothetical protein RhiirA4_474024 [Rhizophagus irregularis]
MMKKYSDHLMKVKIQRVSPSSNCNIRLISKHVGEIDERYSGLDSDLKNKELFDCLILISIHMGIILELLTLYGAPDTIL